MFVQRLVLFLAALLASLSIAAAAFVEDRSPFRQGHWFDSGRSGHGFEILSAGENVFLVWYTYDTSGQPIWYTAQGTVATMGSSWTLQKHRWGGTRIAESTTVGSISLRVNHFESMTATWELGGAEASWSIEPFVQSATINEVDLSGHWYDPSNSGWGMTLVDQGDVFGAVIYAYDAAGAPTWIAGFDRGKGTHVSLYSTRGACPSCNPQPIGSVPVGSIDLTHRGDTEITLRSSLSVAFASGVRIDGAQGRQLGRPASLRRADYQLVPFRTEIALKAYLVAGMANRLFASTGIDFSPAPPSAAPVGFSTTNVQVEGVDEADLVKTDGGFLYAMGPLAYSQGSPPTRKVRIARLGEGGSSVTPVGEYTIQTTSGTSAYYVDAGLYLHAGNLVTIGTGYYYGGWYYSPVTGSETNIEVVGVSNPTVPVSRYRATLPGTMVSSRRVGDKLYVITRYTPNIAGYIAYPYTDAQRNANQYLAEVTPLLSMLPWISENGGARTTPLGLGSIYAPQYGGSPPVGDMVVVSVFDVREPRLVQTLAIVGRTESMYVSTNAIYLASSRYDTRQASTSLPLPVQKSLLNTDIHKISIGGDLSMVGSGSVEGWVNGGWWGSVDKAAFRFGEMGSRLGVVTSTTTGWWGTNSNRVTVLEPSSIAPGLLKTVSYVPNARRPDTLGKPNEALYGTRFVGNKLYAVTFRRTDPLYTVDLSDASDPRISGALEVPGFSDYLHPMPNGLLLGFGHDANDLGVVSGLAVSLFDVSGPAPLELQRLTVGTSGSDSPIFSSHHALSVLTRADGTTSLGLPARVNETMVANNGWTGPSWSFNGLLRFELRGSTPKDARLFHTQTLKTQSAGYIGQYPTSYVESSYGYGRSVLFPDASVYVGEQIWRQDAAGNVQGPY